MKLTLQHCQYSLHNLNDINHSIIPAKIPLSFKYSQAFLAVFIIRPEDIILGTPGTGLMDGVVSHLIFKGVHYEMEVTAHGFEWLVHSTTCFPVGTEVSLNVEPANIQIMHKPASDDEKAVVLDE